ncbi:hypothetical protein ACT3TD_13925 [Corynebacterium sp. AOP36-E1-14]|uniref:hypothetical protein n=1 Tax=unclassified Corynebacterium TaxID=2624378 RepID=UPI00403476F3
MALERFEGGRPSARDEYRAASASAAAKDRRHRELQQSYVDYGVIWWLTLGFRVVRWVVPRTWVTLVWVILLMMSSMFAALAVVSLVLWVGAFMFKRSTDAPFIRFFLCSAPVLGDGWRLYVGYRRRKMLEFGNALLREAQMVSWSDEREYFSVYDFQLDIWEFDVPLAGATEENVAAKIESALPIVGAADYTLQRLSNSAWSVDFFREKKRSALDEPRTLTAPPAVDWDKMAVAAFYDEEGAPQSLSLSGTSGTLVGGVPGGGKTAFINEFLTPLLIDDRVKVTVCDGKGGADFDSVAPYVDLLWQDDEDFDGMIELLESKQAVMRERIKTNKQLTGESNFWNSPIVSERPVELIVMDEVQAWTEKTGRPKAEKEKMERIEALIRDLIKRGRSAGIHVILSTQKPDANTISTAVRDLTGRRVAFRVSTPQMREMILGQTPDDAVSPTDIPADRIGGCVIGSETGLLIQARAYFMSEKSIEAYLAQHGTVKEGNRFVSGAGGDGVDGDERGPGPSGGVTSS